MRWILCEALGTLQGIGRDACPLSTFLKKLALLLEAAKT